MDTFSLAKAIHHLNIAKDYLEVVRIDCHSSIRHMFNGYISRCNFILNDFKDRLSEESKKIFKEEMSDSLSFDHIHNQLIMLNNEQRGHVEEIVDALVKGKIVEIKIE